MKKRYLNTIEEVMALKNTDTKILIDDCDDYYKFVDGIFCRFDSDGDIHFNAGILINGKVCYILEEEPMQEATTKDVGKLCWFFNDSKESVDIRKPFVAVLWRIDNDFKSPFVDDATSVHWKHCRRLTPSEVEELTGYKVEEAE